MLGQWLAIRAAAASSRGCRADMVLKPSFPLGLAAEFRADYGLTINAKTFYYCYIDRELAGLVPWVTACNRLNLHILWDVKRRPRGQPWQQHPVRTLTRAVARRTSASSPFAWFLNAETKRVFDWSTETRWSDEIEATPLASLRIHPADGRFVRTHKAV